MFIDSRGFLAVTLLQSAAVVNGRKPQELIREGATMAEGCGQHRCALMYQPSQVGSDGNVYTDYQVVTDQGDYEFFTDAQFRELNFGTVLDKDMLCQICLSPPTGDMSARKYGYWEDFQYVVDDLNCQGFTMDYLEDTEVKEKLNYILCFNKEFSTAGGDPGDCGDNPFGELRKLSFSEDPCQSSWFIGSNTDTEYGFNFEWRPGVPMMLSPVCPTFQAMPDYKIIDSRFWAEYEGDIPLDYVSGDNYYCANQFQNYHDPCCLESLAPSVKPTLPPTNMFGNENSLAPTTASDDNPCFSESATVEVQGKGKVTMKSLQVGDVVLTPYGYEKVYTIDHRSENKPTDFFQIHTGFEEPLEVTGTHLIFKAGKMDPVEARSVKVGDELQGYFDGVMKSVVVEQISSISKNGLYNPITSSGTIVVGGLVTSTYTAVNISDGSNYLTIAGYKVLSMHDFMHMAMVPLKTICMSLSDSSICLLKDGNEHTSYDQVGIKMMEYAKSKNVIVQNAILFSLITLFVVVKVLSTPVVMISLIVFKAMKKQSKIY